MGFKDKIWKDMLSFVATHDTLFSIGHTLSISLAVPTLEHKESTYAWPAEVQLQIKLVK